MSNVLTNSFFSGGGVTLSDLDKYLPLTGGTLSGDLTFSSDRGSTGALRNTGDGQAMVISNSIDYKNSPRRAIKVFAPSSGKSLVDAVQLYEKTESSEGWYLLYGKHNLTEALKAMFPSTATPTYVPVFGSNWESRGYANVASLLTAMGGLKSQTGTYTGTGKYGSSNKNTLTFNFVPKVVMINRVDSTSNADYVFILLHGQTAVGGHHRNKITWSNKTVTWYNTNSSSQGQMNDAVEYQWIALG